MNLREYLFRQEISVKDFADQLGTDRSYISAFKTGRLIPGKRLAQDIVDLTNGQVTIEELMDPKATPKKKRKTKK